MFMDLPALKLKVFYVLNPLEPIAYPISADTPQPANGPYDPSKPTLVFIPAGCRTVAAFSTQFADPRLRQHFNLVGISPKYHGRTEYYGPKEDKEHTLVDAAECVIATLDALGIETYNVFGEGIAGCYIATLLAHHRPERVLRLLLASPGRLVETEAVKKGLEDMLPLICQNKDGRGDGTGTIPEDVLVENGAYCFSKLDRAFEKQAEHNMAFQMRYGTGHSSNDVTQCFMSEANRTPIPADIRASLTQPILILQGGNDLTVSPIWAAREWKTGFVNASGGADLRVIEGGPHLLSFVESNIVDRIIVAFFTKPIESKPRFRVISTSPSSVRSTPSPTRKWSSMPRSDVNFSGRLAALSLS
ncbi:hypothetical protein MNV49_006135 [Pseudohyphozyma bogoriensis]|nr:hypothetical protein MNV49_006135 [Pseudohyphozyma bogoriensis]